MGHRAYIGYKKPGVNDITFHYVHWLLPDSLDAKALFDNINTAARAEEFFRKYKNCSFSGFGSCAWNSPNDLIKSAVFGNLHVKFRENVEPVITTVEQLIRDDVIWLEHIYLYSEGCWYVWAMGCGGARRQLESYRDSWQHAINKVKLPTKEILHDHLPF